MWFFKLIKHVLFAAKINESERNQGGKWMIVSVRYDPTLQLKGTLDSQPSPKEDRFWRGCKPFFDKVRMILIIAPIIALMF
jgi:hypothetical protein